MHIKTAIINAIRSMNPQFNFIEDNLLIEDLCEVYIESHQTESITPNLINRLCDDAMR